MKTEGLQIIDRALIEECLKKARVSERRRTNYNFHQSMEENPHRFLNVMLEGTYLTPHRHLSPPKSESFLILIGCVALISFDGGGTVTSCIRLDASGEQRGVDVAPGIWHTVVVLSREAVCFEVKPGPYRESDDKEFAPWAPRENTPGWQEYLKILLNIANK